MLTTGSRSCPVIMAYHAFHLRGLLPAVAGVLTHDSFGFESYTFFRLDLVPGWRVAQRWSKRCTLMALSVLWPRRPRSCPAQHKSGCT